MKRIILAGFILTLFTGVTASAQNNGGYQDDVYYNASQAEKDAKAAAKAQKQEQQSSGNSADYYNSSDGSSGYSNNNQTYSSYNGDDDAYVDYDDDSYTTRIRRFYYPMYSVGYWGSVYSPFYYDPFYANPYYGWGSWYTPGFSIGFGWGGGYGPYWSNGWGMNTWFGYGGFNSWYYPYGGYYGGWGGYGAGYWNGYYAGAYDGRGYGGRGYTSNYGPRGARNGSYNVGAYGRTNSGLRADNTIGRGNNTYTPQTGRMPAGNTGERPQPVSTSRSNFQVDNRNMNRSEMTTRSNGNINLDRNQTTEIGRNSEVRQGNMQQNSVQETQQGTRRGGFFGFGRNNGNNSQQIERSQRSYSPAPQQRSYTPAPQQQRSNFNTAPSRNFGGGGGTRSFGGGGGGGRSFGGRR